MHQVLITHTGECGIHVIFVCRLNSTDSVYIPHHRLRHRQRTRETCLESECGLRVISARFSFECSLDHRSKFCSMASQPLLFNGWCKTIWIRRFVLIIVLPASLPCVSIYVCVISRQWTIAYFQAVSNRSIIATASVLPFVIGEFVLVVGEHGLFLLKNESTNVTPKVYFAKA